MTLIEVMIAMVLGILVIGGVGSLFVMGSQNYKQDEKLGRINDELRFAMTQIAADIEMAGFWSQLHDGIGIAEDPTLAISKDCGAPGADWIYSDRRPIEVLDTATQAKVEASHDCLAWADVAPDTDVISIKRAYGAPSLRAGYGADDFDSRVENRVYFRTNGISGMLYRHLAGTPPTVVVIPAPYEDWQYSPATYFIRPYFTGVEKQPSLCRKVLEGGAPPEYESECISAGIEHLQIELGVDGNLDNAVDYYTAAPDANQTANAITARVLLLGRALDADPNYLNQKTYRLSNFGNYLPADNFYRLMMTNTVTLRNPANLRALN